MNETSDFKSIAADVKAVASDNPNGEFEAVLSTDIIDRDGESIAAGAFDPLPKSIPIFHAHDWQSGEVPVAKAEPFYDGTTLKARGVFASTPRAQEMRALVTEGIVDSMSVGFMKAKRSKTEGKSVVTKAELFEASFTAIPVNTTARVLATKAGARNNASDADRLQQIHDLATADGAACATAKAVMGDGDPADTDDDPASLAQAVDSAIDEALAAWTDNPDQALALITAAAASVDALLAVFGVADADDPETVPEPPTKSVDEERARSYERIFNTV